MQQFVALRQEVNLQTRASRAQLEQNAQALEELHDALALLQRPPAESAPDADDALRPLLKTLVDVYDALALARREVQRLQENVSSSAGVEPPAVEVRLPFWARWLGLLFVTINAIEMAAYLTVNPFWSFLVITLDIIIIYQLTVRWDQPAP